MGRARAIAIAAVVVLAVSPAQPQITVPPVLQVLGTVTNAARPVANALIIALNLSSFDAIQTYTIADGSFILPPLRGGMYKIIAVKAGFLPATATVVPTKTDQKLTLRLAADNGRVKTANQEIWEIRGSLPADILREIDQILLSPTQLAAAYDVPRLKGEMVSMTGLGDQASRPAFAQTGIDVQSRIGETWQIGFRGDMQRFDDPTDGESFGNAAAESSVMSMELRSSATDAYKINSTRTWWRYRDQPEEPMTREAGVRSHNFEWEHGASRVKVRYFAHENLFRESHDFGSDTIEIGGDTPIFQTRRNDLGVSLRVRQESVRSAPADTLRTAHLAANGNIQVVPAFTIQYGVASRLGLDRNEFAPRTGFAWRIGKETSFVASGTYKVYHNYTASYPSLVVWSDDRNELPKYSYSFGIVSSRDESNLLSAIMTISAADAPLRVVFEDPFEQFWEGLYVDSGDTRRDLRVSYRRQFGNHLAVDVATTAGTATSYRDTGKVQKVYVTGDVQTFFTPTRTSLALSYREIQQPKLDHNGDYTSERVNVRMAQSLYLPVDVKLLVGIELARSENSPFLLDVFLPERTAKKYIGGLSLNF